ncbi:MAG: DUF1800 domain-containing protein [Gammaproteobacteria bacterium]|jgi:uncharacterized protein (DUF1800 family)
MSKFYSVALLLCIGMLASATGNAAEKSFDIAPIADLSSDGFADVAVLPLSEGPKVWLYSSADGSPLGTVSFFARHWMPVALAAFSGGGGEGSVKDSRIALLALNNETGTLSVQVRTAEADGSKVGSNIGFFNSTYQPIDVAVVDDTNGDGISNDPSIAVLAQRYYPWRQAVQLRTLDGQLLGNWTITQPRQQLLSLAGVSMTKGQSRVSALVKGKDDGKARILSVRIADGEALPAIELATGWWQPDALDLSVQRDGDGDGMANDPAYVILVKNQPNGEQSLILKDVGSGSFLGSRQVIDGSWQSESLSVAADLGGDDKEYAFIIASGDSSEELLVNVRELESGNQVANLRPNPIRTIADAFRFLNQATLGATKEEASRVVDMGYEAWIDEQMELPVSLSLPFVYAELQITGDIERTTRTAVWIRNAIHGPDQLRQRVAFALSEIMVVSEVGVLHDWGLGIASYQDMLANNAFGNFRNLMEDVTLHPAMGMYLSMLGNLKPDPEKNIRPDENFARELMQLFTIGLDELNIDGTVKKDAQGHGIPTYTQDIIQGFAHVFTGWYYDKSADEPYPPIHPNNRNRTVPMVLIPERHDTGPKTLLNGVTLPARNDGERDLKDALDNIFQHPNVGPFISTRLIERLVTSNPSPAYVARVARVFNDNGKGIRGDLGAVVKAILLDKEARPGMFSPIDGKLKEPLLRLTQLWRAYGALPTETSNLYRIEKMWEQVGQGPLDAESVFNFFQPNYAPPGEIRDMQLVAPELQIATDYLTTIFTSYLYLQTHDWNTLEPEGYKYPSKIFIDFEEDNALAADPDALIDGIAERLLGGEISATLRSEVRKLIVDIPAEWPESRTSAAIFLIASSPEFAYQY